MVIETMTALTRFARRIPIATTPVMTITEAIATGITHCSLRITDAWKR